MAIEIAEVVQCKDSEAFRVCVAWPASLGSLQFFAKQASASLIQQASSIPPITKHVVV